MSGHGRLSDDLLLAFATVVLSLSPTIHALARGQELSSQEPWPIPSQFGPPQHLRGEEFRRPELPTEASAAKGFVFIHGEYLPPPYEIRYAEGEVAINGHKLTCLPTRGFHGPGYGGRFFGPGYGPGRSSDPWRPLVGELAQHLASDTVVMSFADQPLVVFASSAATYDLLKMLTRGSSGATNSNSAKVMPVSYLEQLPENFDRAVWDQWIGSFEPPANLVQRGLALVAHYDKTEQDAKSSLAATKRLNAWAYPLTIGLMVVTVLAVGHLLGGRPHAGKPTTGIDDSPEMIRALNWSLAFVAMLSLGDLALTILAGQAGQMRELNPLGSHLIHDTRHLFGFKVGATLPALLLLWLLRRHKRAQIAAWWVCLILVIVTFRWLTVNSAFMSV